MGTVDILVGKKGAAPGDENISIGETVCFTNGDTKPHTVAFDTPPSSPLLAAGAKWERLFDVVGTFPYRLDKDTIVYGTIIVS